jgi:hypothetical protein
MRVSKAAQWLLDRPVKPGDDTHLKQLFSVMS